MNSKVILLLAVVGVMIISKVVAECDEKAGQKCLTDNAIDDDGKDEENCSKLKSLLACGKAADCWTEERQKAYDEARTTYKCGAGSLSVSLMFILTTVFITVKNIL